MAPVRGVDFFVPYSLRMSIFHLKNGIEIRTGTGVTEWFETGTTFHAAGVVMVRLGESLEDSCDIGGGTIKFGDETREGRFQQHVGLEAGFDALGYIRALFFD